MYGIHFREGPSEVSVGQEGLLQERSSFFYIGGIVGVGLTVLSHGAQSGLGSEILEAEKTSFRGSRVLYTNSGSLFTADTSGPWVPRVPEARLQLTIGVKLYEFVVG